MLVHGVGQEQYSADILENAWLPALAGGIRNAGYPEVADRLWHQGAGPGSIEARMAFYGNLFLKQGQQGAGVADLAPEEIPIAEQLALEWLSHAAARSPTAEERAGATVELAYVRGAGGQEQGAGGRAARSAINSLSRLPWFAQVGYGIVERFVWQALAQVTRYFTDEHMRRTALNEVLRLTGPDTKVFIGHSLGSVVAYEAAHRLDRPLPLLVTLGSPLGLATIVYPRLRPQSPRYPPQVRRWVNIAALDDLVAAEPDLTYLFTEGKPTDAMLEGGYTVDNGSKPHSAEFYLGKAQTGRVVAQAVGGDT